MGHIAGRDRGDKTVYFEGITLKPEPSIGVDRGGRVVLWGRGCPEELHGRAVDVKLATGLMLGDHVGDQPVRKRRGHIEGYGMVWAASKSVSLLLAVLDDQQREELLKKFEGAVRRAIDDAEEWLWVRRGAGGKEIERVSGALTAYAVHATNGRGDPHLHVHVLLRAVARCEDGEWRTIDSESVLEMAKKILDARIARYLRGALEEMGIAVRERIVGSVPTLEVPALEPLTSAFALRAQEVLASEGGGRGWRNHLRAWYESRRGLDAEALEHAMDTEVLEGTEVGQAIIAAWRARLEWTGHRLQELQSHMREQPFFVTSTALEDMLEVAGDIVRLSDLVAYQAYRYADYMSDSALGEIERTIRSRMINGVEGWRTTLLGYRAGTVRDRRALYRVGGKGGMLIQAEGMRQTRVIESMWERMLRDESRIAVAVAGGDGLSDEQRAALAMIASGRRVIAITGVAGAGKSQTLECVLTQKYILARNAVLGSELAQRVKGRWATLASADRLLREVEERDKRGETSVVVIDEGSLVDRADWLHVLGRIRKLHHTQLVVLGDTKQIDSIDHTHVFRLLIDRARSAGAYAELHTSRRTAAWLDEHRVLRDLPREVEPIKKFLELIASRGGLVIDTAPHQRAAQWIAERLSQEGQATAVAIVARNEDAAYISAMVQRQLGIVPVSAVALRHGQHCGTGDRVRLRINNYKLGVFNGQTGTVVHVDAEGVKVRLDSDGREIVLPRAYCQEGLELGYCVTADSAQGLTLDQAVVLADGMDYRRVYVAATRSRQPPVYVASSEQAMATALAQRESPQSAADLMVVKLPRTQNEPFGAQVQRM